MKSEGSSSFSQVKLDLKALSKSDGKSGLGGADFQSSGMNRKFDPKSVEVEDIDVRLENKSSKGVISPS